MDYCTTCRRHLNGALVCPGCGAYAPDIAPMTMAGWYRRPDEAETEPEPAMDDDTDVQGPRHAPVAAPAPHGGRAARRRQLARLKKHQRRAMIATAVALVGGGLSFATMERGNNDRAQAATTPDDTIMGGTGEETTGVEEGTPQQDTRPASPTPSTPASDPASPQVPGQQSGKQSPTTPRTTQSHTVVTPPTPQQQRQSLPLLPSTPDTPATTPTPTPSASASTAPAAPSTPSQTPSTPAPTSPPSSQLCLLVICLG
ncbi:SCO2400 family protein [Streptomyces sp. 4N124]|uniref:SCO2400 family protein n=1 Tax=Streptomyces sp. 4N124 TaxID=3457420 RepID=UPI003FD43B10